MAGVQGEDDEEFLAVLRAEREIQRIVLRYAHGIDRPDFELVRACFHDGARLQYGELFDGPIDEAVEWLRENLGTLTGCLHHFGAPYIEFGEGGTAASVETYAANFTSFAGDAGGDPLHVLRATRYLDRFENREGRWAIVSRRNVVEWSQATRGEDPTRFRGRRES